MRKILAASLMAALMLTACGGQSTSSPPAGGTVASQTDRSFDVSKIEKDPEIAAMLPAAIADRGKLVIGAAIDYAPAEFRADDLQTAIGYDVDLGKALGRVLGVDTEVSAAEFASLLPGMGTKFDIGISSFTITNERMANFNMISYIMVGSSYAVQKGNPESFDPDAVCGASIGVQTGTYQADELETFSKACTDAGKPAVEILSYSAQSDVTTNLTGGKIQAMYADSTVADYSVALTNDQLEVIGGIRDAAPQGIVVPQADEELTKAIQAALQKLMDEGVWVEILTHWGVSKDAALTKAEINPTV